MNKKRRASSVASSKQDEEILDDSTPEQSPVLPTTSRKRKRLDPSELCQQLYDSIRNIKKEDGTMICDTFIRAPKRRQEPSYYEVVTNPIDLLKVQQKLKTDSYEDIEELTSDIELLVNNAKAFYKSETPEYQDACSLWTYFLANKNKILELSGMEEEPRSKRVGRIPRRSLANESEASEKGDEDLDVYEELFASVMSATDPTMENRPLHKEFQLLPSKRIYPEYYDVIDHPIDLRLIATKIQTNAYETIGEMEKDLLQMTKNACLFNEPGSQIYKDAKTLKKIFTTKKIEIESGKAKPTIVMKRRGQSLSATIASLKKEVDSSDDEDEPKMGEGPMWKLFDHLFNAASASEHPNATGAPLGQTLWKLPMKRFHPEYFELIKRPICMSHIQTKLKTGEYGNISDLTADLYLMLDNAKKAYPPTHRTHKDAVKMLKIMNTKLVEDTLKEEDSESEYEESNEIKEPKKKGRARRNSNISTPSVSGTTGGPLSNSPKSRTVLNAAMKKKVLGLQKYLIDYTIGNRRPVELFMEKPPRKLYPDYYEVIQHPIDMTTIENNIRSDKYSTIEDLIADYRLMFSNCRQYNEEGSMIYEDSVQLEKALNEKLREFPGFVDSKRLLTPKTNKMGRRVLTPLISKLWQFYDTIKDYHEPKGNRQLSMIFMKLPSKNDYPDYYDIIKDPIDMEKIAIKLRQNAYESIDELGADFLLMLENACKYNEPDSQIYKDALVLQQMTMKLKQTLRDNDEVPDVQLAVQELLLSLFTSLYNHQDEEGRCFSDSLAELPEYDEHDNRARMRGISLDLIKRRLDKVSYKRLDTFQEDVFSCLERARKLSRTDSQIFEDSIELQTHFIKTRDELCKDTLTSPALQYTMKNLTAAVESLRQIKLLQEVQEQEEEDKTVTQGESMTIDQKVYSSGDFVYYETPDNKIPAIAYIERLWTSSEGIKMMTGTLFMRPHETFHLTTRKFLEKELFRSDQHPSIPLDKVLTKCYVMHIKDYIKLKPVDFAEKDVYVCESNYSMRTKSFKKLKTWMYGTNTVTLVSRSSPIELKRVMSVFKERIEKHKGELAELKLQEALVEKDKPNVSCSIKGPEEDATYFEQYNTICSGVIKTGDFVYVATQAGKQSIAHIHSIWETVGGKSYFQGPWLLTPNEINPPIQKSFYRQEVLLSTVHDVNPMISVVGRCSVLENNDYFSRRPTEIAESDVYIVEHIYDELKKSIKKLNTTPGLKKFEHCDLVIQDEIFHFKRPAKPAKNKIKGCDEHILLQDLKSPGNSSIEQDDSLGVLEDSLDGTQLSINSDIGVTCSPAPSIVSTPVSTKAKPNKNPNSLNKPKLVTGYILYSGEIRKGIAQCNPDVGFGEISRIVGNEWKNLPTTIKQSYEDKALRINEETAARKGSPTTMDSSCTVISECLWDNCDFQFEDVVECMEHCIQDNTGHVQTTYASKGTTDVEFHCMWKGCIRMKKSMPAFPSLKRLIKHVREVHLNKKTRVIPLESKSKNFVPRKARICVPPPPVAQPSPQPVAQPIQPPVFVATAPPEPMFVTVPPRPQKVLHSEAYIRYIEGLQNNAPHLTPWRKTITATPKSISTEEVPRLANQWLGKNASQKPEEVVNALWHLRNFMMKDVLEIKRNCF